MLCFTYVRVAEYGVALSNQSRISSKFHGRINSLDSGNAANRWLSKEIAFRHNFEKDFESAFLFKKLLEHFESWILASPLADSSPFELSAGSDEGERKLSVLYETPPSASSGRPTNHATATPFVAGDLQSAIANEAAPEPTAERVFNLTSHADVLIGRSGNNSFIGTAGTIQSNDVIIGGDGFNVANFVFEPSSSSQLVANYNFTMAKMDQVKISVGHLQNDQVPVFVSAQHWSEIDEIWVMGSANVQHPTIVFSELAFTPTFLFWNFSGNVYTRFQNTVDVSTLSLVLEEHSSLRLSTLTNGDWFDRLNVTSSGNLPNVLTIDFQLGAIPAALQTMFLFGNAPLTLLAAGGEFANLALLDATNLAGGFTIRLASDKDVTVLGGLGSDSLTISKNFRPTDSFDGGNGTDTLSLDINEAQFATSANVRSVEHLVTFGRLTANSTITNSAQFKDIALSKDALDVSPGDQTSGHVLHLNGFDQILLDTNVFGELRITGSANSTLVVEANSQAIGDLNFVVGSSATIDVRTENLTFDKLKIEDMLTPGETLRFVGTSNVVIRSVEALGGHGVIDLSQFTGGLNNNFMGAELGGFNFLLGDLHRASQIRLDTVSADASEVLFGKALSAAVSISNMKVGDRIDLGQLGVSDLAGLTISYDGDTSHITSKTFGGEIDVVGVDLTAPSKAALYIDFNGHIG